MNNVAWDEEAIVTHALCAVSPTRYTLSSINATEIFMLRSVVLVMFLVVGTHTLSAQQNPYQVTITRSELSQWPPFTGTPIENVPWGAGDILTVPAPGRPVPMYGQVFEPADIVSFSVSDQGSFYIGTTSSLAYVDGAYSRLDSALPGALIGYQYVVSATDPMYRVRFDSVSFVGLETPNFLCFEIQYHFRDGAFDILYGPSSENTREIADTTLRPVVGIALADKLFTQMYHKARVYGNPQNPQIDTSRTMDLPSMYGVPVPGTHIHFAPVVTTEVVDPSEDPTTTWKNVQVIVYDLMGRQIAKTTTTPTGSLASSSLTSGPVLIVDTQTHRSKLVFIP